MTSIAVFARNNLNICMLFRAIKVLKIGAMGFVGVLGLVLPLVEEEGGLGVVVVVVVVVVKAPKARRNSSPNASCKSSASDLIP
jgi:hypothetical protein